MKRIEKLLTKVNPGEVVVIYSGDEMYYSLDQNFHFQVERNFFYLTGLAEPRSVLLIINNKKPIIKLYKPFTDPETAKWNGSFLEPSEATAISGIKEVYSNSKLDEDTLNEILKAKPKAVRYVENSYYKYPFLTNLLSKLAAKNITTKPVNDELFYLRSIKDSSEIDDLKTAIKITNLGLMRVLQNIKKAKSENECQGIFEGIVIQNGCPLAFPTISANHYSATTLHYTANNAKFTPNTLLLMDLGASFNNYCADISRTYPISGTYSERQKLLYNCVLEVNQTIIKMLKPGLKWSEVNRKSHELMAEKLLQIGLIKEASEEKNYYLHSVGHPLGLDTHDVRVSGELVLEENMIVTVEPGLYIKQESIGIRIEDDVLITKDGAICLSEDILKDPQAIENYIAKF